MISFHLCPKVDPACEWTVWKVRAGAGDGSTQREELRDELPHLLTDPSFHVRMVTATQHIRWYVQVDLNPSVGGPGLLGIVVEEQQQQQ